MLLKKITIILIMIAVMVSFSLWTAVSSLAAETAIAGTGGLSGEPYFLFPEQFAESESLSPAGNDDRLSWFPVELQRNLCFAEINGRERALCLSRTRAFIKNNAGNDNAPPKLQL